MASEREIHDYFFGLIGKRVGDPADDWREVLQGLVDRGMLVNYVPEEQAKHNPTMPFRGLKIVMDRSGTIRGNIQAPAHERDANGFYTHEYLVIRDRVPGQPPFVGPFDWGWSDRGGGTPYLLPANAGGGDGGDGGDGGSEPPAELEKKVERLEALTITQGLQIKALEDNQKQLLGLLERLAGKVRRLRVVGPTASRVALGRHYHDIDLEVVDPEELPLVRTPKQ